MITTIKIHNKFKFENSAQKNERSLSEVLSEVLTKKDYKKVSVLIEFIEEHGEITPKEAESITKKSAVTVRRYLKILVDTNCIVAEGNTNNARYRVSANLSDSI